MENIAVLSHCADIDGVGAASLLKIKYSLPSSRLFFSGYAKEDILYAESKFRKFYAKDFVLFVTDLNANDPTIPVWRRIIKEIKSKGGKVFWFDHHPWSKNAVNRVAKLCDAAIVGENARYCATEITKKELRLDTPFVNEFCRVVHFSDFNLKPDTKKHYGLVKAYALCITSLIRSKTIGGMQKDLRHITDVIEERKFVDKRIKDEERKFEKLNTERINRMLENLHLVGSKVAIGFASGVQSTQACGMVIKRSGRDIGIVIDPKRGRGSIRSIKSDISRLAAALGGGGHPHASGFELDLKVYPLSSEAGRIKLIEKIGKESSKLL